MLRKSTIITYTNKELKITKKNKKRKNLDLFRPTYGPFEIHSNVFEEDHKSVYFFQTIQIIPGIISHF